MDVNAAVSELIKLAEKTHGKYNKHVIAARDAMKDEPVELTPEAVVPETQATE